MTRWFAATIAILHCGVALFDASAADLSAFERRIAKPPAFRSAKPRYCLVVFGMEAKTRVWLVLDGDRLFVDRNGNGDLTEAGECCTGKRQPGGYSFSVGAISDGPRTHTGFTVAVTDLPERATLLEDHPDFAALMRQNPRALTYYMVVSVSMPGWTGSGPGGRIEHLVHWYDFRGFLQWSDTPATAPVIHFGGPWSIVPFGLQSLSPDEENDLVLACGTPGLGNGTVAYAYYEKLVPDGLLPSVDLVFPPTGKSGASKMRVSLPLRC